MIEFYFFFFINVFKMYPLCIFLLFPTTLVWNLFRLTIISFSLKYFFAFKIHLPPLMVFGEFQYLYFPHILRYLQQSFSCSNGRCSVKRDVLKDFANFAGKHLCWSLFLIKSQALVKNGQTHSNCSLAKAECVWPFCESYNFIKKILQHRCFLIKFAKFLRTPILKNTYKRLLLNFAVKYGVFSGPYFPVFGLNTETYFDHFVNPWNPAGRRIQGSSLYHLFLPLFSAF